MAEFNSDTLGATQDRVSVRLNGEAAVRVEAFRVQRGILAQPQAFSVVVGEPSSVAALADRFPPNTPFQLFVGDRLQFTGLTDGFIASGNAGATIELIGRDALARLHDSFVEKDDTIKDVTPKDLVTKILERAGVVIPITTSNKDNRDRMSGGASQETGPPIDVESLKPIAKPVQAKVGQRWYDILRSELDSAGLFLWASADGNSLILTAPNPSQAPMFRLSRRRGQLRNEVNVVRASWRNLTTGRFSEVQCFGRSTASGEARQPFQGSFSDEEIGAYGILRKLTIRSETAKSAQDAATIARRAVAQSRRDGWQLEYELSGLTLPRADNGERAVLVQDTVVDVVDDEFGIVGPMYVESVEYNSAPQTSVTVNMMRPGDVLFGPAQ